MSAAPPALRVRDLEVHFAAATGPVVAVDGVSLDVRAGEVLAVVGESGAGKSALAAALLGLPRGPQTSYAGSVEVGGVEMLTADPRELAAVRGRRIALAFQEASAALNPVLRIGDQLAEAIGGGRRERRRRVEALLGEVGFGDPAEAARAFPFQLSGGMRQRAMLAIALARDPDVLIADEPTTALDVTTQAAVLDLLARRREQRGTAMLVISHDLGVVAQLADRVAVMYAGRIVEQGPVTEVFADPRHPYTWGLLGSICRVDDPPRRRLAAIPGASVGAGAVPGCAFAPRCPHAFGPCETDPAPPLAGAAPGHRDACWLELSEQRERRTREGRLGLWERV